MFLCVCVCVCVCVCACLSVNVYVLGKGQTISKFISFYITMIYFTDERQMAIT